MKLAVAIPVHGPSEELAELLGYFAQEELPVVRQAHLLIANSGGAIEVPEPLQERTRVEAIGEDCYWAAAVARLYACFHESEAEYLLLMNHDVLPLEGCLERLLAVAGQGKQVLHPVLLLDTDRQRVAWAGLREQFARHYLSLHYHQPVESLPTEPFASDTLPGKCVLLPREAVQVENLEAERFPHYFSDYVQGAKLRRAGWELTVVPAARAIMQTRDAARNKARHRCDSLAGFWRTFTSPVSARNFVDNLRAPFYLQSSLPGAMLCSLAWTGGKLLKGVLELLRLRQPL